MFVGYSHLWQSRDVERKELDDATKKEGVAEFNLTKGLLVATISGILSACFNFGIEAGKDMAAVAIEHGANPPFFRTT